MLVGSGQLTSPTGWVFQCLQNNSKELCVSLEGELGPAPRLLYSFLTALPLSLHPLPSLISNFFELFGNQGRSRRLNAAYFL